VRPISSTKLIFIPQLLEEFNKRGWIITVPISIGICVQLKVVVVVVYNYSLISLQISDKGYQLF
jgi:hypothetical protein